MRTHALVLAICILVKVFNHRSLVANEFAFFRPCAWLVCWVFFFFFFYMYLCTGSRGEMRGTRKQIEKGATSLQYASLQALYSWSVEVCLFKKREMQNQVRR